MVALAAPARTVVQLARVFASPRKMLLIHSHNGRLTGNALGLAVAAQASPDFLPVLLLQPPHPLGISAWQPNGKVAGLLLRRAAVIAYTGRARSRFAAAPSRTLRLFLWHGMPIKGIGKFDPAAKRTGDEHCDLAIATSERMAEIMSQSFGVAAEKFVICGEPKTDALPKDRPGWNWSASLRDDYRIIIGYFPTWREHLVEINGRTRRREDDAALGRFVSELTGDAALRQLLARHRASFVIRTHVLNAVPALSPPFFAMDDSQGDATHLLQECDVVVSDYSSVVIDALLFDRPLALWCEDLEKYTVMRPLPYFDFHDVFGWALKPTLAQLRDWLAARLDGVPLKREEVEGFSRARALFHRHGRGGAGERLLQALRQRLARRRSVND
jgi:CDP-glycerol glycerophosphotransferase